MIDYKTLSARFVTAKKELVEELLELNTHNRTSKPSAIDAYQKDMASGNFYITNQGIGVSKSGVLLDGQNRLLAMRQLDYPPIVFLLVCGLEDVAQAYVDIHTKRSQTDTLKLLLNQNTTTTAVAALNARQLFHTLSPTDRLTIDQLAQTLAEHHEILSRIISATRNIRKAGMIAALFDYSLLGSESKAIELAHQIGSGELLERNDPAYKVREAMTRPQPSGQTATLRIYRLTISACHAHWDSAPLVSLKETEKWRSFSNSTRGLRL